MQWDIIIAAVWSVIVALVGAYAGWFLSERSAREREKRTDQKVAESVRILVALEIDQNIEELVTYWANANNVANPSEEPRRYELQLVRRITRIPSPSWSREAWASQLPHVTRALHNDQIRAAHNLYKRLNEITGIATMLNQIAEQQVLRSGPPGTINQTWGTTPLN